MEINAECEENRLDLPQEMSITNIFKHPSFVEEYQKVNPAKWITVPIEEMSIISRTINEGLPKAVRYSSGLDGHEYYLKTYGKQNKNIRHGWKFLKSGERSQN